MANVNTGVRGRLHTLLWTFYDDKTKSSLLHDGILPDQFLRANHVHVIAQDFDEIDHTPPVLFKPRQKFSEDYLIKLDLVDPRVKRELEPYMEHTDVAFKDLSVDSLLGKIPRDTASYLFEWSLGGLVPCDLPLGIVEMFNVVGIESVSYDVIPKPQRIDDVWRTRANPYPAGKFFRT
jgi:hypothetical protein